MFDASPAQSPRNMLRQFSAICLISLLFVATQVTAQTPPGGAPQGPTNVGTVTVKTVEVPYIRTLPGRAVAFETGEIRARVSGLVEEILYTAGDKLKPGDPMFKIEDTTYVAAFASANVFSGLSLRLRKILLKSTPPNIFPTGGITIPSVKVLTIFPNEAPMMTPTAMSRTLPLTANSLKSSNIK